MELFLYTPHTSFWRAQGHIFILTLCLSRPAAAMCQASHFLLYVAAVSIPGNIPHRPWHSNPQWSRAYSLSAIHDHTQTHHTRWDSSGRVISPTQRPLPDNTQHSQQTDIHVSEGIRTHNPNNRTAAGIGSTG